MAEGVKTTRPDTRQHFINRARVAAEMSTCLRRAVGAVIIKDGVEVSSGYVGAPRGEEHCTDLGTCFRQESGVPSGENYELCMSVHAEQNAIINAARIGVSVVDGIMYIYSKKQGERYHSSADSGSSPYGPCILCKRWIVNAGIAEVVMMEEGEAILEYSRDDVRAMLSDEQEKARAKFVAKKTEAAREA